MVLYDNQKQIFVWGNHDFLSLGPHSEECQVVEGINVSYDVLGLLCQVADLQGVLSWLDFVVVRAHSGSQELSVLVNDEETSDTSVVLDSCDSFFDFSHCVLFLKIKTYLINYNH